MAKIVINCQLFEFGRALSLWLEVGYANTNSKKMNDLAFHYKYSTQKVGGVQSPTVPEIIWQLNRMPMGALKYVFPIKALMAALYKVVEK